MSDSKVPPSTSPRHILSRLTQLTSTLPGLDASLMLAQYSSPLVVAILFKLASFRTRHPRVRISSGAGKRTLIVDGGLGFARLAEGWGRAAASVGDARVVMRAFGLLPMLQWLLSLHPKPILALKSLLFSGNIVKLFRSKKTVPTLQALAIILYYPLEHISWLGSKGVVHLSPAKLAMASLWSVRFWALYVMLEIYKLRNTYRGLCARTRTLKQTRPVTTAQAGGYDLQSEKEATNDKQTWIAEKQELEKDWQKFKLQALTNSGYAPLTIHWSTPGGLWSNPLITGSFGSVAAIGSLLTEWSKYGA
ncbi:hypothetical protein L204_102110 [Cryptococcus depauperatus]